jgi:hypothetical protein
VTITVFAVYPDGRREEIGPDEDGFYSPPNDALYVEHVETGWYDFHAKQVGINCVISRPSDEEP